MYEIARIVPAGSIGLAVFVFLALLARPLLRREARRLGKRDE
jgi:hypothetical protein